MEASKFTNKDGSQTAYALACGYIQTCAVDEGRVELYQEHGAYHVRYIATGGSVHDPMAEWHVYDALTPARKMYKQLITRKGSN